MFIAAKTKQPKSSPIHERINKIGYIYAMEYYLAIKKNEMVPFVAAWMGLDITILSEVSQMEKDKYMISLICI